MRLTVTNSLVLSFLFAACSTPATKPTTNKPFANKSEKPATQNEDVPYDNDDWWPNRLDLRVLKANAPAGDPVDPNFNYARAFSKLDLKQVKKDIAQTLKDSKSWWPADWGHYGGLMIRLAWHSSGTYRVMDGRGGAGSGTIRFAPLNSWPDNANLDKARRLLWPVKKKYGRSLSWADLMILTGNVAFESMGFKTYGFGGGRVDVFEPTDIDWGPETEWLTDKRFKNGKLQDNLAATVMGLIYVNPEGPNGKPDPVASAQRIRVAFGRMGMNDEETVALIAGGHTLGKMHGAAKPGKHIGPEPERASTEELGTGWKNTYKTGKGPHTITSGLEGAWTNTPIKWSHGYLQNLWKFEWELTKSPGGMHQWVPKNGAETVPDAHIADKRHKPVMLTTDLALRFDPAYAKISKRFLNDQKAFEQAFAKAWYKLTHRDMGPHSRLLGPEVPAPQIWQDPVPTVNHKLITGKDASKLKTQILESGLTVPELVRVAWGSASSYRDTDMRGGANGARIRLAPMKNWAVNQPAEVAKVVGKLESIQKSFNAKAKGGKKVSLADLIVLGGNAAIEKAAKDAGVTVAVPFSPGRTDATEAQTDADSFKYLKPTADGFRNYYEASNERSPAQLLIEKADFLTLTAPEMTVLIGGMRALNANYDGSKNGVLTEKPGVLNNHFFVNLLDMGLEWKKGESGIYEGRDRKSGQVKWTATQVDLAFGSNSQLRALCEVYAGDKANERFVKDFVDAWSKVMKLDRFDLQRP